MHVSSPAPREVWQKLVDADPDALAFQTPAWMDAICDWSGFEDASRLYEFPDGRQAVLPLVRRRVLQRGPEVRESLPHNWGTGGAVSTSRLRASEAGLVLADLLGSSGLRSAILPSPLLADVWTAAAASKSVRILPHVAHVLDLTGGPTLIWNRTMSSSTRTKIRRAGRSGLEVEVDRTGALVEDYHALYEKWMAHRARTRGIPLVVVRRRAEPLTKYRNVARRLGSACTVFCARLGGEPVAGLILLTHGSQAMYWRGASDLGAARSTNVNSLLQWLAIQAACDQGCHSYHMGESGGVQSLQTFKERFGAQPHGYPEIRVERLPATSVELRVDRLKRRVEERLVRRRQG